VRAPYEVANLSIRQLLDAAEAEQPQTSSLDLIRLGMDRARAIEANPEGEMGFRYGTPLDEHTSMRNGDLVVIASRPSIGKTASGLDILTNVTNDQDSPGFFASMEMSNDALATRIVGRESEVDHGRILTGKLSPEDWEKIQRAEARLAARHDHIRVDDRTKSTERLLDVVGEWVYQYGKGPLVVDYLQLGKKFKGESTPDAVSRMALEYKAMAKILEIPVVALTQLNRSADDATEDSQTYDHWLRSSGDIEAAADVILILLGERTNDEVTSRTMVIHKERQRGAGARVKLDFHQAWQRFAAEGTWRTGLQLKNHADYALRDPLLPARGGIPLGGTLFEVTS
jgi:replicative DNA helicase